LSPYGRPILLGVIAFSSVGVPSHIGVGLIIIIVIIFAWISVIKNTELTFKNFGPAAPTSLPKRSPRAEN